MKAKGKSKPTVSLEIRSVSLLRNYILPFLNTMPFISKKGHDYADFLVICNVLYVGGHNEDRIRDLILKLLSGMNDFRLSTYKSGSSSNQALTSAELTLLKKVGMRSSSTHETLESFNVIYLIIKSDMSELIVGSLKEAATIVDTRSDNLSKSLKSLPVNSNGVEVNNHLVRRVQVFCEREQ
jgi:hypothetical protein